jgi:hypothetical protein
MCAECARKTKFHLEVTNVRTVWKGGKKAKRKKESNQISHII